MSNIRNRRARHIRYLVVAALLTMPSLAIADGSGNGNGNQNFSLKTTVAISGSPLTSFDISWVNPRVHAYFLSDRSNKAVDVINTITKAQSNLAAGQFAGAIPLSTACPANACNGPNGVLTVDHYNRSPEGWDNGSTEVWAGDGPRSTCTGRIPLASLTSTDTQCSTVKVIDYATGAVLHNIPTGGQFRADELCYDPVDHLIQIANDSDTPPYINYIPTEGPNAYKVIKQIDFDGLSGHGPNATNGIEQCQWNPRNGLIYLNVPEVNGNGGDITDGQTVIIDPRRMEIIAHFDIPVSQCAGPQGMAIGPAPQILLGCNAAGPPDAPLPVTSDTVGTGPQNAAVLDENTGRLIKVLANQGGNDEVWFNPGDGLYFLAEGQNAAAGAQLGIVSSFPIINLVQDITIANPPGAGHAHSVAADPIANEVYMPIPSNVGGTQNPCPVPTSGCVAVYSKQVTNR
jgi:hypothetical protein